MQTKGTLSRGCIVARPANNAHFSWNLYKMPNYLFWNVWFPNILLKFYLNKHKLKEILQFTRKNMYTAKNIAISTIIWAGNKICSQQDRDISCNFLIIHYLQVWLSQRVYSPRVCVPGSIFWGSVVTEPLIITLEPQYFPAFD